MNQLIIVNRENIYLSLTLLLGENFLLPFKPWHPLDHGVKEGNLRQTDVSPIYFNAGQFSTSLWFGCIYKVN